MNRHKPRNIDFHPTFSVHYNGPDWMDDRRIRLHIFVDCFPIEAFAEDRTIVFTNQIFPAMKSGRLELYAKGGPACLISLDVWKLDSIWE